MRQVGWAEMWYSQDPYPRGRGGGPANGRITITIAELLPKERGIQAPHQDPQPGDPTSGRQASRTLALEAKWGLLSADRQLWEIETRFLKGKHKISHTPRPRADVVIWKESESDPLSDHGGHPREAGGNWDLLWGHRHWQQPLLGACCTTRKLELGSTILEFSLWLISTGTSPSHQPVSGSSTGTPPARELAGGWGEMMGRDTHSPAYWQRSCRKIPWAHSCPRTKPCSPLGRH